MLLATAPFDTARNAESAFPFVVYSCINGAVIARCADEHTAREVADEHPAFEWMTAADFAAAQRPPRAPFQWVDSWPSLAVGAAIVAAIYVSAAFGWLA